MGRKKKIEEELSKARQQATELETALQNQEERRRLQAEAEERDKLRGKRAFANPQTAEEAEGEFPSMEWLATGFITKSEGDYRTKTREEILNEGTLLEKLRLFYSSQDLDNYFDTDSKLTKEELAKIRTAIQSREDIELVKQCSKEFRTLLEFGRRLSYQFKRFQATFSILAVLLNRWDGYESTAKQLSFLFNFKLSDQLADHVDADKYPYEPIIICHEDLEKFYSTDKVEAFLEEYGKTFTFDGATLQVDKDKLGFVINVDGKGNLYSQIKETAKEATQDLKDFKAYAIAAEEYIAASTLHYMPVSIQMSIENAEEERYTRYLVRNLSFFRSELNDRKFDGETITPEEEKRAVIPDYYEIKPTAKIYRECKKGFRLIESGKVI